MGFLMFFPYPLLWLILSMVLSFKFEFLERFHVGSHVVGPRALLSYVAEHNYYCKL
jgi:hypothetical protein